MNGSRWRLSGRNTHPGFPRTAHAHIWDSDFGRYALRAISDPAVFARRLASPILNSPESDDRERSIESRKSGPLARCGLGPVLVFVLPLLLFPFVCSSPRFWDS